LRAETLTAAPWLQSTNIKSRKAEKKMSIIKKKDRAAAVEVDDDEQHPGRLHSASEMNAIFADWNADRGDETKLNTMIAAIIDNVVRTVGANFAKRPPLYQREDVAMETVIKVLQHLPGSSMHEAEFMPFDPTRPDASFNSFVNLVAHNIAVDLFRKGKSDSTATVSPELIDTLDSVYTAPDAGIEFAEQTKASKAMERTSAGPFEAPAVKRGRGRPKQPGLSHLSRRKRQKVKATSTVTE
jgi:DNA-directed RNA polymerase specialized sigma24 family protein